MGESFIIRRGGGGIDGETPTTAYAFMSPGYYGTQVSYNPSTSFGYAAYSYMPNANWNSVSKIFGMVYIGGQGVIIDEINKEYSFTTGGTTYTFYLSPAKSGTADAVMYLYMKATRSGWINIEWGYTYYS